MHIYLAVSEVNAYNLAMRYFRKLKNDTVGVSEKKLAFELIHKIHCRLTQKKKRGY